MAGLATFVLENCNAPGTALTVNLAGPPVGRCSFAQGFVTGVTVFYFMDDGIQAEWGTGMFTAGAPNTVQRTTVIGNTAGTLARLNFTGATRIYNEVPASYLPTLDPTTGNLILLSTQTITGQAAAVVAGDVPQLQQIAWGVAVPNAQYGAGTTAIVLPIPTDRRLWGVEWDSVQATNPAGGLIGIPVLNISRDGGITYSTTCINQVAGSGASAAPAMALGVSVAGGMGSGRALWLTGGLLVDSFTNIPALARYVGAATDTMVGAATHVQFTLTGTTIASVSIRLLGAY